VARDVPREQECVMTPTQTAPRPPYALLGFLAAAIAIVGMLGMMATFATRLPLERALAREVVLDRLLAANGANYAQLTRELADSAKAVQPGPDLARRVAAERVAMRARLQAQSDGTATRLRLMLVVCSLGAMLFGWIAIGGRRPGSRQ
jgi:hypothetical protein